jgi:hypothetical protein
VTVQAPGRRALRDVIAAAIWARVTQEDGIVDWADLWPVDREEFEEDADAVLAALVAEGYSVPKLPEADLGRRGLDDPIAAAIDTLAREAVYQLVLAEESLLWEDFSAIGERDWEAVVQRVRERTEANKPTRTGLLDAYEYLAARAEVSR